MSTATIHYLNKQSTFSSLAVEGASIYNFWNSFLADSPKDAHRSLHFDDHFHKNVSERFLTDDGCIQIPYNVKLNVKLDYVISSQGQKLSDIIKAKNNLTFSAQKANLLRFMIMINKFPEEHRLQALVSAIKNILERMTSRLFNAEVKGPKGSYYKNAEKSLGLTGTSTRSDSFKKNLDAYVKKQLETLARDYNKKKRCCVGLLCFELMWDEDDNILSLEGELRQLCFDFKKMEVHEQKDQGEDMTLSIWKYFVIDADDDFDAHAHQNDYFLQDNVNAKEQTAEVKEMIAGMFEQKSIARDCDLAIKLYNIAESMERDKDITLVGIERVAEILRQFDMMMNGGKIFGVKHTVIVNDALYKAKDIAIDPVCGNDDQSVIKNSLLIQLRELIADEDFDNLEIVLRSLRVGEKKTQTLKDNSEEEQKTCGDCEKKTQSPNDNTEKAQKSFRDSPQTGQTLKDDSEEEQKIQESFRDVANNQNSLRTFMHQDLQTIFNSINSVALVGFTKLTSSAQFSIPLFIYQDQIPNVNGEREYFFSFEHFHFSKLVFKGGDLQETRKDLTTKIFNSKTQIKRIYIQQYPHPDIANAITFELRHLMDETQLYKALMIGGTKLSRFFRDEVAQLLKKLRAGGIIEIYNGINMNENFIKKIQDEMYKDVTIAYEETIRILSEFKRWRDQLKSPPTIEEQAKFFDVRKASIMYVIPIDDVNDPLQKQKLDEHRDKFMRMNNGAKPEYAKCGFSDAMGSRLRKLQSLYTISKKNIHFFFCFDRRIEENFHKLQSRTGGTAIDTVIPKWREHQAIFDKIGYIMRDKHVQDTEMYLCDDDTIKQLSVFEDFIKGCDYDKVVDKIETIITECDNVDKSDLNVVALQTKQKRSLSRGRSNSRDIVAVDAATVKDTLASCVSDAILPLLEKFKQATNEHDVAIEKMRIDAEERRRMAEAEANQKLRDTSNKRHETIQQKQDLIQSRDKENMMRCARQSNKLTHQRQKTTRTTSKAHAQQSKKCLLLISMKKDTPRYFRF